jgi:hypothetical protein
VEEEKMVVAREWLCKHVSTAAKSRDHNNRGTVVGHLFYAFCPEAILI